MPIGDAVRWTLGVGSCVVLAAMAAGVGPDLRAQDPKPEAKKADDPKAERPVAPEAQRVLAPEEAAALLNKMFPAIDSIRPVPPPEIPDDPPPHEGAMIDYPMTVEPPDIIIVEVLEALAGRPITGERLVRQDGTITLGFYGDVHVRGLTVEQIKTKVVLHMRRYLADEALGMVGEIMGGPEEGAVLPPPDRPEGEEKRPEDEKAPDPAPEEGKPAPAPKARSSAARPRGGRVRLAARPQAPGDKPEPLKAPKAEVHPRGDDPAPGAGPDNALPHVAQGQILIPPADSDRVFVDISSYNHTVYYVLGDFNTPGRLPWTGNETVLDAIQYSGGLDANADPKSMKLVRPARGGKPAKVYPIDLEAIQTHGDPRANLQIFPGDRLVVERDRKVAETVRLNAEAAPQHTLLNSALVYLYVRTQLDRVGGAGSTPAEVAKRAELLKSLEELWASTAKDDADRAFREQILKSLR